MRTASLLAALAACVGLTAGAQDPKTKTPDPKAKADEPAPLLKAVAPTGSAVRVRFPAEEGQVNTYHISAQVPKGKSSKGSKAETVDIVAAFETLPGKSYVAAKKWQSWGYDVPPNKVGVLPELIIPASQIAPNTSKGGKDVLVRFPAVRVEIIEPPGDSDTVFRCDMLLSLGDLTKNADRAFEPRLYFADRFMELTVPTSAVTRPGTDNATPADPRVNPDPALVPAAAPTTFRGSPLFTYASINGLTQYKTPDGKFEAVAAAVSPTANWREGIIMTIGTARGCGIEVEAGKDLDGMGVDFKSMFGLGKVKEFRLGLLTGPGLKTPKDLVLKDVTVVIDKNNSGHFVWLGPKFVEEYFKDGVYAMGNDGWRLHGRIKPDLLFDPKTRIPPKKP